MVWWPMSGTRTARIPASKNAHTYSEDWTYDSSYHWHNATCGCVMVSDKDWHNWGESITVREASDSVNGLMRRACSVCGLIDEYEYSKYFTIGNGTIYLRNGIDKDSISSITIPKSINGESVTTTGRNCFINCENLESVFISDSLI